MEVTVRFFAAARSAAGTDSTHVAAGTLASLVVELTDTYPELQGVLPRCSYLVNGTAVHGEPSSVAIDGGAEVDVLPPFAGG